MSQEQNKESQEPQEVIVKNDGSPFETQQGAALAMSNKRLSPEMYHVGEYKNGYGIFLIQRPSSSAVEPHQMTVNETLAKAEYFKVVFQQKSSPNDDMDVKLSMNGSTLIIPRGVETIIPKEFKEIADHAVVDQFQQLPGQSRKKIGQRLTYPYVLVGVATEEDYRSMKRDGDAATRIELRRMETEGVKR